MKAINNFSKLLLITLIGATGLFQACSEKAEELSEPAQGIKVDIATISAQEIAITKQFTGVVESALRSEIGTKIMGEVQLVPVNLGNQVKKGEVIVRIKDGDLNAKKDQINANLEGAKARLEVAESDYNRFKKLYEQKSATQKEWDDVQLNYTASKASIRAIESQLEEVEDLLTYTSIKAPYDGVVAAKYVEEGDIASPGRPLIAIELTSQFKIVASIPESEIQNVSLNEIVKVTIPAAGVESQDAKATSISSAGDPVSKQFLVELELIGMGNLSGLRSGMFAEISIQKPGTSIVSIPSTALVQRGQLVGAYILNTEDIALLRWIRIGKEYQEFTEVLSGLREGERYVVKSDQISRDAQKVLTNN